MFKELKMKNKLLLIELIIAALLAGIAISYLNREKDNFEEFALGKNTSSYFPRIKDRFIHINKLTPSTFASMKKGWEERGEREIIYVSGNSQTHGINQKKSDQGNYPELLFHEFQGDSLDVLTHSIQNANLQELLLSFSYFKEQFPIRYLVIPIFMDDLRESGIRKLFFTLLHQENFQLQDSSEIVSKINIGIEQEVVRDTSITPLSEKKEDFASLDQTVQEKSEIYLNNILDSLSDSWRNRPNLRGRFFVNLYLLRNTVFGINAQTERPIIPQRYEENMSALEVLLKMSEQSDIKVLLYIPPIRNDVKIPYNLEKYESFKNEVKEMSEEHDNVIFKNFEDIVPGSFWGTKEATSFFDKEELDFMHFQYEGHNILFDSLKNTIRTQLK